MSGNGKSGRHSKLTPEVQAEIVARIKTAATYDAACQACGINYMTFNNWMSRGEKAKSGIYFEFFEAVKRAEGICKANMAAVIARAANEGDWRAAEAYLKRRDRANWGDQVQLEHSGDVSIRITDETDN
jgi:transposase